jgi:hypothetical protein
MVHVWTARCGLQGGDFFRVSELMKSICLCVDMAFLGIVKHLAASSKWFPSQYMVVPSVAVKVLEATLQ